MIHQRWNAMDCNRRYEFLCTCYGRPDGTNGRGGHALSNVLSKFSLQRWSQLPFGMRCFISRIPYPPQKAAFRG